MNNYDSEEMKEHECKNTDCDYWGQGGCMLPGRCIYTLDEEEDILYSFGR